MKSPYKNFVVFRTNQHLDYMLDGIDLEIYEHRDPTGGQWKNGGLAKIDGEFFMNIGSGALLMHVQFNERILPSKVRDEEVKKMAQAQEERTGRKPGKKEWRILRDEAETTLLPKAFIRRTTVPVIFYGDRAFVFTSSLLKSDSVIAILLGALEGLENTFTLIRPQGNMRAHLTNCLTNSDPFEPGSYAKFKGEGEDKKTVAVKDLDLGAAEVEKLTKQGYQVDDIELIKIATHRNGDDDASRYSFKLNSKFIFRAFTIPNASVQDVERDDQASELQSFTWLSIRYANEALDDALEAFGGETETPTEHPNFDDEETAEEEL